MTMETTTLVTSRQSAVPSATLALHAASAHVSALGSVVPLALVVRAMSDASALSFDAVRATLQTCRLALAASRDMTTAFVAGIRPAPGSALAERSIEIVASPLRVSVSTSSPGVPAPIEGEFMPPNAGEAPPSTAPRSSRRKRR